MSKKNMLLGCALMLTSATFAQTDEQSVQKQDSIQESTQLKEVVITGTRFELPVEKSGKTIYTLTPEAIKQNAGKTVVDLLNEVPGLQMEGNFGSPGTNVGTFVRGGRNKNTLILIDGVPYNDPSSSSASYDLRLIGLSQIESIEVLKGGLSTLYGTGASAAVINIKLKESSDNVMNGDVDVNGGSYKTYNLNANVRGQIGKFNYAVSGSRLRSDGFSSAINENPDVVEFDKDGIFQHNGLVKLGYKFSNKFKLNSLVAFDEFVTEYDGSAFTDADNTQFSKMLRFGLTPTFSYNKGKVELKAAYAKNRRIFESSFPTQYEGKNLQLDLTQQHQVISGLKGIWGINLQHFEYRQPDLDNAEEDIVSFGESAFTIVDPYASLFYEHNSGFNLHIGARVNTHSEYDSKFLYNINPSCLIDVSEKAKVKVFYSLATSYITPTGFQLFSQYGNTDLNPESSLNEEKGLSFYYNDKLTFNAVYFNRREENPIDFVSLFDSSGSYLGAEYQNIAAKRDVQGVELDVNYTISKTFNVLANYTYINTEDNDLFYRIPQDKAGATLNVNLKSNTTLSLKANYTGPRFIGYYDSTTFSTVETTLPDYTLFDLYAQQQFLNKKLTIYGAINNILDKDFVSIYGYTTRSRNFNVGARFSF